MTPDDLTGRVRGVVPWEGRVVHVIIGMSPDGEVTFIDGERLTPDEARRFAGRDTQPVTASDDDAFMDDMTLQELRDKLDELRHIDLDEAHTHYRLAVRSDIARVKEAIARREAQS